MAGYRRQSRRPTKRARQAARHRGDFEAKLAAAAGPGERLSAGYAYVLAGLASRRRRGLVTPAVERRVESLVAELAVVGDELFGPGA